MFNCNIKYNDTNVNIEFPCMEPLYPKDRIEAAIIFVIFDIKNAYHRVGASPHTWSRP